MKPTLLGTLDAAILPGKELPKRGDGKCSIHVSVNIHDIRLSLSSSTFPRVLPTYVPLSIDTKL
jgi:hypothetical protein